MTSDLCTAGQYWQTTLASSASMLGKAEEPCCILGTLVSYSWVSFSEPTVVEIVTEAGTWAATEGNSNTTDEDIASLKDTAVHLE